MINTNARRGAVFSADAAGRAEIGAADLTISLVHHVPGRVRLRAPALKGDTAASEKLRAQLAQIAGVISVAANSGTGSLLLEYAPAAIAPEEILRTLGSSGLIVVAEIAEVKLTVAAEIENLASAVGSCLIRVLAERLALGIIGALA